MTAQAVNTVTTPSIDTILSQYWMFSDKYSNQALREHLCKLHNNGTIRILYENMQSDKWDGSLLIDYKDLSALGVINQIVSHVMAHARFDEIRVIALNGSPVLEMWWD